MIKTEFELSFCEVKPCTKVTAIVVAAGRGTRMGKDKQLIELCGVPVIIRSISAFSECDFVDNIVVVANDGNMKEIEKLIADYNIAKVTDITLGGDCRENSVLNGVGRAPDSDIILIHDGARPLVGTDVIERVKNAAEMYGAAIPTVPLKDTVKKIDCDGAVVSTPDRNTLRAVQTPQGFRTEVFKNAVKNCPVSLDTVTDDSSLVELSGGMVYTVDGDYDNIKITTREDLILAESILTGGNEKCE